MTGPNPWLGGAVARGADYDRHFDELAASGADVHGEARFVADLGARRVLDAGCGTGRVALELARRGHEVVGVDLDPAMLAQARCKAPGLTWLVGDLATCDTGQVFDLAVLAGNVMLFVDPGTEQAVLANIGRQLRAGGLLVSGFALRPTGLDLVTYDRLAAVAGFALEQRWASWDREPFVADAGYAVSVHRAVGTGRRDEPPGEVLLGPSS